jgi:MerR family transcriptional regulator, light-induced transcriptional regulator
VETLKTSEAASLLNVSPNTLRAWERRFGFPRPQRSSGKHRLYPRAEIMALRAALEGGRPISSAVSVASDQTAASAHGLFAALMSFREELADEAMEASLALRSLERSLEEVLLPALEHVRARKGHRNAYWAFATGWANAWLERTGRIVERGTAPAHVLIGDCTESQLDPSAPYVRALAVCCRRAGAGVLTLSVRAGDGMKEVTAAFEPSAVVIAGGWLGDDEVAGWAYALRAAAGELPFLVYHRGLNPAVAVSRREILPSRPVAARRIILEFARPRERLSPFGGGNVFATRRSAGAQRSKSEHQSAHQ